MTFSLPCPFAGFMLLFILCYHHDFYNRMLSSWLIHQIAISMVSTTQRYRHDFHNRTLIPWFHQQNAVMVDKTECYHCDWHNRMLSPQLTQQIAISVSPWLTQQNDITMIDRTLSPSLTQQNAIIMIATAERCAVNLSSLGCSSVGLLSTNGEPIRLPCHIMIDWQSCWHCSSHHRHTLTQHGSAYGHGIITFKLRSKIITKSETLNRTEKGQLLDPKSDWKRAVVRS